MGLGYVETTIWVGSVLVVSEPTFLSARKAKPRTQGQSERKLKEKSDQKCKTENKLICFHFSWDCYIHCIFQKVYLSEVRKRGKICFSWQGWYIYIYVNTYLPIWVITKLHIFFANNLPQKMPSTEMCISLKFHGMNLKRWIRWGKSKNKCTSISLIS